MNEVKSQVEVLNDTSASGRKRPWAEYKIDSSYIALAYDEVDPRKAERMRDCSSWLSFCRKEDGTLKLHDARFCRVRLCPICQWRRALKTTAQMLKVLDVASNDGYQFIFLTLTLRNCAPYELSDELTHVLRSFNRLIKYKRVAKAVKGFYRGCEVTHNWDKDTYHPHLHVILAVKPTYFNGQTYISHDDWVALWKKALQVDYTPVVDIRKCYGGHKRVAEACKYAVKPDDILNYDDWDMTVDALRVLDKAFEKRRFIGLGGIIRDLHKQLNLDDIEDGDLVHVESQSAEDTPPEVVVYFWNGYNQYEKN